jgi:hypothetical protein
MKHESGGLLIRKQNETPIAWARFEGQTQAIGSNILQSRSIATTRLLCILYLNLVFLLDSRCNVWAHEIIIATDGSIPTAMGLLTRWSIH